MNIPNEITIPTKEFVQIFTKFCLYLTKYGAKAMEDYLDSIPLRMAKSDGKHLGAYIINTTCQEFEIDGHPLIRHELFSTKERRSEYAEARMLLCVLTNKYVKLDNSQISAMFNKTRHFAKRAISDFEKLDESIPSHRKLIAKYKKIDALISAYVDFKPKSIKS
jgi:hypothetical protein